MGVTPGATGADFDVLLQFSLDEAANERVQKRVSTIEEELKRIQDEALKAGKAVNTSMKDMEKKADAAQKSVAKVGIELATLSARTKQSSSQVNQALDGNIRKYKELEQAASKARQQSALISGAAGRAASTFGQGLLFGGAVVGGIVAEANRYAKEEEAAGRATQATREWTKATEDLAQARRQVDQTLLKEALPLLQQAARVANQASNFIEKHREIVQASLNAGLFIAGVSAVGAAVSKGIKLIADARYITAAATELVAGKLQEKAARDQLAAAALQQKTLVTNRADDLRQSLGQTVPTGQTNLVGAAGMIVTGLIVSGVAVTLLDQLLEKSGYGQQRRAAIEDARDRGARIYPGILPPQEQELQNKLNDAQESGDTAEIERLRGELKQLGNQAGQTASDIGNVTNQLADRQAIGAAFGKWKEDDARLISDAAEKRQQIIADAESQIASITRNYSQQRVQINQQYEKTRASLISNYAEDLRKAEQDYAGQRADIIRDGGEEIRQIEADHQEQIRKMTLDHNQNVEDLTAARDALGLAKEERRFNQERAESEREVNREIAQRRQDLARRLADLAENYAAERAQRQQQFTQAMEENEAQHREQLQQAAAAQAEELKQAREAKERQLKELQEGLNAERSRRRENLVAELRDLDVGLLGERNLRKNYYDLMYQDALAWAEKYRATLPGGTSSKPIGTAGSVPVHDYSGYAYTGLYQMAANGQRQFVMGGDATRVAERIIGTQLTQENLMRALAASGPARHSTYQNNMKLYQTPSKEILRLMDDAADRAIGRMLGS